MFKKLTGIFLTIAMALTSFMTPVLAGEPFETDSIGINPVIKDGQTYLINFGGGSITDGVYNDGTNNIFKFAGDPANVSITDGQLKIGNVTASTVGAFDYGFTDNPTRAFSNFEVSYDITVVNRRADQNLGFQFWKGNWSDGWTARAKVHTAFDAKMNLFEGSTSIENIAPASDRYRYIKDFGVPDLNRDTLPWETFRVNIYTHLGCSCYNEYF